MPNLFAYAVLLSWPLVALVLFYTMSRSAAIISTVVAGYLLLPSKTEIDLPSLPPFNKETIPTFAVFGVCILGLGSAARRAQRGRASRDETSPPRPGWLPSSPMATALIIAFVFGSFVTGAMNGDPVRWGDALTIQGLSPYDAASMALEAFTQLIPFLIARRYLHTPADHRLLLAIVVTAALLYSPLVLAEVRLAPQFHQWVYGFHPSSWLQVIRFGGWRPLVFLNHGLALAYFYALAVMAAAALCLCAKPARKRLYMAAFGWLIVMLLFCRSVGPIVLTTIGVGALFFLPRRFKMLFALACVVFLIGYPILRGSGVLTTEMLMAPVDAYVPSRSGSFAVRVENEFMILERASERPLFGWGSWGRWRIYDALTGRDLTTSDGLWAITMGERGWVGFLGLFGLLSFPIVKAVRLVSESALGRETIALAVISAVAILNLIPNPGLVPLTWLFVGSVLGRCEQIASDRHGARRRKPRTPLRAAAVDDPGRLGGATAFQPHSWSNTAAEPARTRTG